MGMGGGDQRVRLAIALEEQRVRDLVVDEGVAEVEEHGSQRRPRVGGKPRSVLRTHYSALGAEDWALANCSS
jgi:hypothetical protein